ncbi:MAG: hypothetical protein KC553_11465 [Nitrospina sp.]|nr:hypothetical protein [Nitrospina sp.]
MTTSDQNSEQEKPASPQDRLEEIKKEEKEDASTYYAQGDSGNKGLTEAEFNEPVPPVDSEEEEMSLLKAVAFLGFGMAALAIIFILFFIRDLGNKVGDVDAAVATLEQKFGPIKQEMSDGFSRIDQDVSQLKSKVGNYEKMVAVMELKRAKVAIQEVTANADPDMQAKSAQLVSSINGLLIDLGAGDDLIKAMPPVVAPAASSEAPAAEAPVEEAHVEETPAPAEPEPAAEAPAAEESAPGTIELASEGESAEAGEGEGEDGGDEESADEGEEAAGSEGGGDEGDGEDDEEDEEDE